MLTTEKISALNYDRHGAAHQAVHALLCQHLPVIEYSGLAGKAFHVFVDRSPYFAAK